MLQSCANALLFKGTCEYRPWLIRLALVLGADLGATTAECRNTPLHKALTLDKTEQALPVIRLLIESGAPVNAQNAFGIPPLHFTIPHRSESDIPALLLARGADPCLAANDGDTAILRAAQFSDIAITGLLLTRGAPINSRNGKGQTPLHLACEKVNPEYLSFLLAKGADTNLADNEGVTPLHIAARRGIDPMINTLIDHGANPNVFNKNGFTPLHVAAMSTAPSTVDALLARGANIDAHIPGGRTALMVAVDEERVHVARMLVARGADLHIADSTGRNIFDRSLTNMQVMLKLALANPMPATPPAQPGPTRHGDIIRPHPRPSSTPKL